jgi:hypothetical protein
MNGPQQFRLPKDIPLDEYPKPEIFLEEANRLTETAQQEGILLRVMGPIALHRYFPDYVALYRRMERLGDRVFTDIDYAAYGKQRGKLVAFFQRAGYQIEKRAMMIMGTERHIYFGGPVPMVDVFFDKLSYNHPISYLGRLEMHPYCVSLTDLLLQKLQIVEINDKDLKDVMLLLLAAPIGQTDQGEINLTYLAHLFADDWGFYTTSAENLKKVKLALANIPVLIPEQKATIVAKADQILEAITQEPKTKKWKKRAEIGTKRPWYNEVADWL